jgi:DNA-binding HxlR family transcriptional regulator
MATGLSGIEDESAERSGEACAPGVSVADVLRLIGAGATGAILMALGQGPLRTKNLTEQVPGYAPRTIYRYSGKLAELEVVEREEEPGVPSKVVYCLTDPCGADLYGLVNRFADASLTRLPDGRIDAHAWASLALLADLWEAGMVGELSCEARSPTDLARGPHGLSYHQVNRRAGLFKAGGLLCELEGLGRRRLYALTEKTRRKMGLVVAVAHWRHLHVAAGEGEGMTAAEMATVLRVALPLIELPEHAGKCLSLSVRGEEAEAGGEGEEVVVEVKADGTLDSCGSPKANPAAWGRGQVQAWIPALLDGDPSRVLVGGDQRLVGDCLSRLYETLWTPQLF